MTDLEQRARRLVKLATRPTAVVVSPHAIADPQALADELGVEIREWAGGTAETIYVRSAGEAPMGTVVASPR